MVRNSAVNTLSLFILTLVLSGVRVEGGYATFIIGGAMLAILFKVLKPMLSLVSLPLNLITLGTFSFLINVLLFYLATTFIPQISIKAFVFEGISFGGFVIPKIALNTFFAYVAASFLHVSIVSTLNWLIKR